MSSATDARNPAPSPVRITLYRWAGRWGPFRVKIPCGECALTRDVILDALDNELAAAEVELEVHDWLSNWWKPLRKGGWHAPIVLVEDEIVSQGEALNRGVLAEKAINAYAARFPVSGNRVFGKENCPHCQRAKRYLDEAGIAYTYLDVVKNPGALYEMLARVKPIIGPKTPVTVPQIWLDGTYIGGADHLAEKLGIEVEPNPERGQSSMSPGRLGRAA